MTDEAKAYTETELRPIRAYPRDSSGLLARLLATIDALDATIRAQAGTILNLEADYRHTASNGAHPYSAEELAGFRKLVPTNHTRRLVDMIDAQAETIRRMGEALRSVQAWDMLNPPQTDVVADLAWLKRTIDAALASPQSAPKDADWHLEPDEMAFHSCATQQSEQPTPDSPPFTPPELRDFAARGYERRNRRKCSRCGMVASLHTLDNGVPKDIAGCPCPHKDRVTFDGACIGCGTTEQECRERGWL